MDWSYIAGFFDGEGNFHIVFTKRSLQLVCRIYGNSVEVFNEMINFMGFGKVYYGKGRVPELIIQKKDEVKVFIEKITPFLILKRNQAIFLLKEYHFERDNNLNLDLDKFHEFPRRKGKEKFYSPVRKNQIQELKTRLATTKAEVKPLTE
jgi:hypothetical protein